MVPQPSLDTLSSLCSILSRIEPFYELFPLNAVMEEVPDASLGGNEPDNSSKLRSYQQEMLEESLKHNVIVAVR